MRTFFLKKFSMVLTVWLQSSKLRVGHSETEKPCNISCLRWPFCKWQLVAVSLVCFLQYVIYSCADLCRPSTLPNVNLSSLAFISIFYNFLKPGSLIDFSVLFSRVFFPLHAFVWKIALDGPSLAVPTSSFPHRGFVFHSCLACTWRPILDCSALSHRDYNEKFH